MVVVMSSVLRDDVRGRRRALDELKEWLSHLTELERLLWYLRVLPELAALGEETVRHKQLLLLAIHEDLTRIQNNRLLSGTGLN